MSKLIKILRSNDRESNQRQLARLKKEEAQITEEIQLIEMTLDKTN